MSKKYQEYRQLNMPAIEQDLLQNWETEKAFQKSVEQRQGKPPYVFYEGPPSANGMPGIHHVISRTLKDLVCRYKTMQGFQVKRKAGWDTHGLPVELGVEKALGITKEDIGKTITVEAYNNACRKAVMQYKAQWDELTRKMGYWVDLENPYITFENNYIETLWWALKSLFNKDLLYKSVSIQPYSPAAGTGLSSHELNQPGTYRNVKDTTCVAMFKAVRDRDTNSQWLFEQVGDTPVYFMAWTTTPWTLPSNCGLTVGPNIEYALLYTLNPYTLAPIAVVVAQPLLKKYFSAEGENGDFETYTKETKVLPWKSLQTFAGKALENLRYEQLLPYPANTPERSGGDPFRIILGDFVTTEDGTGIVHTAPAFGADDFKVGKANNLGIFTLVDRQGKFVEGMGALSGRYVKNYKDDPEYASVDVDIAVELKQSGLAFRVEKYEHSYPHCWRTDKPVIYYPLDAWFIRTTAMKDRLVELNKTIRWKPASTGEGRFGNWLENMVDWNLSRSRFWGTPLPVWVTEDGTERKCIGSIEELTREYKKALTAGFNQQNGFSIENARLVIDLHKPYVDQIVLVSDSGKPMTREPDLIDVWFDSGAMPLAQWHFPFENKALFAENYPADFIAEGVDQTRGWFYTLHALAGLLKESILDELRTENLPASPEQVPGIAYKTVIANGLVLDKDGNKMSKRLGNVVDPFETIATYSADATRWYLITNAAPWESLRFDSKRIEEVQRKFFGTLYNTYQFFALYANVDNFTFKEAYIPVAERPEMDRWILSALNTLVKKVTGYLDDYEPTQAGRAIDAFLDESLSNWYVRLCRRRFWKGEYGPDKIAAYQTLYECVEKLSLMMAPIAPFFADWLYRNLNHVSGRLEATAVHLADFPHTEEQHIDTDLEERMHLAQLISSLTLSIRKKVNLKVRQPLQKLLIPVSGAARKQQIRQVEDIILAEVNVKELDFLDMDNQFIRKKIKPDFKVLGKKVGAKMKAVATAIASLSPQQIINLENGGTESIEIEKESIILLPEDVVITAEDIPGWSVAHKEDVTVALDVQLSESLQEEGAARELVNRIQKIRKDSGLELTDRIIVYLQDGEDLKRSVSHFNDYIRTEILADTIDWKEFGKHQGVEIEVNDSKLKVLISKNT